MSPSPVRITRVPSSRLPLLVTSVSCVGIVTLGWFLGAGPALDSAALSTASITTTNTLNDTHRATLVTLAEQHSHLEDIRADALSLRKELPAGLGLPDLVDQMSAVAASHHVIITQYTAEEPVSPLAIAVASQPPAPVAAPAVVGSAGESGEGSGNGAAPGDGDAVTPVALTEAELTAAVAAAATAPSSRLTTSNLYAVPITLTLSGTPEDARATLGDLQHGTRLFFVTSAEIVSTVPANESLSEVRGYAYVLIGAAIG